jgi:hypothetical protein
MRPEALRGATKKAAEDASPKLEGRLSRGEKRGRKRMAEIGAVYDVAPVPRSSTDVMASKDDEQVKVERDRRYRNRPFVITTTGRGYGRLSRCRDHCWRGQHVLG